MEAVPAPDKAMRQVPSSQVLEAGEIRIDTAGKTATLRGLRLQLTAAEFDVLVFLGSHPQQLFNSRTVLATNWSAGPVHQTELLKSLFSLRKKIEAAAHGQQYLRAEPLVIYRFDPNSSLAA
jgi:DNA-binding response OmpR family regulator